MFSGRSSSSSRRTGTRPERGSDVRFDLEISFEEAVFGTETEIKVPSLVSCPTCHGNRQKPGSEPQTCSRCNGTGEIRRVTQTAFGQMINIEGCGACRGNGTIITDPCDICKGAGKIRHERKINVKIPAGVDTGSRLRVDGEGRAGNYGGPSGDLYVVLHVEDHKIFIRDGPDIYLDFPVTFTTLTLGAEVEVPTVRGKKKLVIPAGTQSRNVFTIKGEGIPSLRGRGVGNQYVRVLVRIPTKLSKRQKELLQEMEEDFGNYALIEDKSGKKSLFERIKASINSRA